MSYKCPMCGREMERNLTLFLDHTQQHVIDQIKIKHPEWVAEDGVCRPCAEYYEKQMSGEAGRMNIGPRERQKRKILGIVMLAASFALAFFLILTGANRFSRAPLFFPIFIGLLCLKEAKERTCVVLAELGSHNLDLGTKKIENLSEATNLKIRGRGIIVKSTLWALLASGLILLFPS